MLRSLREAGDIEMIEKPLKAVGVGLGPSNLALATAIEERNLKIKDNFDCLFLESNRNFQWHPGMLIPGMQLQVPFFRDLATVRNPQSPFTFLNYLKSKNRLDQFINLRTFYPSRVEYHDYLTWVCERLSHITKFGCKVKSISPVWEENHRIIKKLKINYVDKKHKNTKSCIAENVIISVGGEPYFPPCVNDFEDDRIVHTSSLLKKIPNRFVQSFENYHFIVIGSGQSAGEAAYYLLKQYPNARVSLCFRNYSLHAIDNSPFVNLVYHQSAVDSFYKLSNPLKIKALHDLRTSNYSVVDLNLLNDLFKEQYLDLFQGKERLKICPGLNLENIMLTNSIVQVDFKDIYNESTETMKGDAVILATGYVQDNYSKLLDELNEHLKKNDDGEYLVSKNYQIQKEKSMHANVYLQGYCESTHGPSDSTLAIMSTRAELILEAILNDGCSIKNNLKIVRKELNEA